ncbi:DNA polymerase epsilon subunit C [[Candida] jaroonii]|uniref:DNA polymerase epsilon subunit C n=1 Tax=[Candida] jaroonii TaxID=467808 RepID=A0ACA9Y5K9_9ASCO|nr:DNA polymerase epsilon subunit C [[Candida] jaroonii]
MSSPTEVNDTPMTSPPNTQTQPEASNPPRNDIEEEEDTVSLPLSKIKRIFKMDSEYTGASQSSVYSTAIATELFIQYLTEQAVAMAKLDKRKKLLYKDLSNVVSSQDSLNFLVDTVPKTVPLKEVLDTATQEKIEQPKPQPKVDITNMFPRKEVKKATITDLVSNDS